jgi:hypothetical protein
MNWYIHKKAADIKIVPCGLCFQYVYDHAYKSWNDETNNAYYIHAMVNPDLPGNDRQYMHAWVEEGGIVYDWQTMERGLSKYSGTGWPVEEFYELFRPFDIKKYTAEEIVMNSVRNRNKGPWEQYELP